MSKKAWAVVRGAVKKVTVTMDGDLVFVHPKPSTRTWSTPKVATVLRNEFVFESESAAYASLKPTRMYVVDSRDAVVPVDVFLRASLRDGGTERTLRRTDGATEWHNTKTFETRRAARTHLVSVLAERLAESKRDMLKAKTRLAAAKRSA